MVRAYDHQMVTRHVTQATIGNKNKQSNRNTMTQPLWRNHKHTTQQLAHDYVITQISQVMYQEIVNHHTDMVSQ